MAPKEDRLPDTTFKLLMVFLESKTPDLSIGNWMNMTSRLEEVFDGQMSIKTAQAHWTKIKKQWTDSVGTLASNATADDTSGSEPPQMAAGGSKKAKGGRPAKNSKKKEKKSDPSDESVAIHKDEDDDDHNLHLLQDAESDTDAKPKPKTKTKTQAKSKSQNNNKGKSDAKTTGRGKKRAGPSAPSDNKNNTTGPPTKKSHHLADGTPKTATNDLDTFLGI